MKLQARSLSTVLLVIGFLFLMVGMYTDQTIFTWISAALIVVSLVLGGRWLRLGRK